MIREYFLKEYSFFREVAMETSWGENYFKT